VFHYKIL